MTPRCCGRSCRSELRALAQSLGVKRGRNKKDTVENIINSGKTDKLKIHLR